MTRFCTPRGDIRAVPVEEDVTHFPVFGSYAEIFPNGKRSSLQSRTGAKAKQDGTVDVMTSTLDVISFHTGRLSAFLKSLYHSTSTATIKENESGRREGQFESVLHFAKWPNGEANWAKRAV